MRDYSGVKARELIRGVQEHESPKAMSCFVSGMSVLPLASGAHNLLESCNDKNKLSDVQMTVNSSISITCNDKNKLGNEETSELRVRHSPKKK